MTPVEPLLTRRGAAAFMRRYGGHVQTIVGVEAKN
jgi:hypothetical protein